MASKRAVRRRACEGKCRYKSEELAANAARALHRQDGDRMGWYRCPFCHTFHVGHMPARVQQSIRDRRRAHVA